MDFIEPCFGIGHNLSLICQMTSEDIKHQLIIIMPFTKHIIMHFSVITGHPNFLQLFSSHTHTHTHVHACSHSHTCVCARSLSLSHTHMRVHAHTHTHVHAHALSLSHTHTHMLIHTRICMHMHTHTHTHTHIHTIKKYELSLMWWVGGSFCCLMSTEARRPIRDGDVMGSRLTLK